MSDTYIETMLYAVCALELIKQFYSATCISAVNLANVGLAIGCWC